MKTPLAAGLTGSSPRRAGLGDGCLGHLGDEVERAGDDHAGELHVRHESLLEQMRVDGLEVADDVVRVARLAVVQRRNVDCHPVTVAALVVELVLAGRGDDVELAVVRFVTAVDVDARQVHEPRRLVHRDVVQRSDSNDLEFFEVGHQNSFQTNRG